MACPLIDLDIIHKLHVVLAFALHLTDCLDNDLKRTYIFTYVYRTMTIGFFGLGIRKWDGVGKLKGVCEV